MRLRLADSSKGRWALWRSLLLLLLRWRMDAELSRGGRRQARMRVAALFLAVVSCKLLRWRVLLC